MLLWDKPFRLTLKEWFTIWDAEAHLVGDLKGNRDLGVDVRDCMFDVKSSLAFLSSPYSPFFPLDATKTHLLLIAHILPTNFISCLSLNTLPSLPVPLSLFMQTEPRQREEEWQYFICIVAQAPSMHLNKITVEDTHKRRVMATVLQAAWDELHLTLIAPCHWCCCCSIFSKNRIHSNEFLHFYIQWMSKCGTTAKWTWQTEFMTCSRLWLFMS